MSGGGGTQAEAWIFGWVTGWEVRSFLRWGKSRLEEYAKVIRTWRVF